MGKSLTGRLNLAETVKLILEAAERATIDAEEGNYHKNASWGIPNEQWTQSYVADALSVAVRKKFPEYGSAAVTTLETNVSWLQYFAHGISSGKMRHSVTDRSRYDIAVWDYGKNRTFYGLIELKNDPNMSGWSYWRDIEKIESALMKWRNVKWGIFIFSIRSVKSKDIDEYFKKMILKNREKISLANECEFRHSLKYRLSTHEGCKSVLWCCVKITKRTR